MNEARLSSNQFAHRVELVPIAPVAPKIYVTTFQVKSSFQSTGEALAQGHLCGYNFVIIKL